MNHTACGCGVVTLNFCANPWDDTAVYLNNFSGKYSQPGAAKNSFSIYRVNAVSMTAPEAQFKRL
ncbi:hypothetical protein ABL724_003134 [Escherichia coli]|nr:hypothetical protein [Escherichia coli]EKO4382246.1 hypothetical protein [Escherichia coli]ELH4748070.1 hypothetical protein [Escherichia coli]HBA9110756.1 hypothetical protein [Escherichia coli]